LPSSFFRYSYEKRSLACPGAAPRLLFSGISDILICMKKPLPKLLSLVLSFLKIGAFTFGGGYAMIALLENEFVSRKKWMEKTEFLDMLAVAESTPGPIAVNTATFIGYRVAGVIGSLLATLSVCLPAFAIIFTISLFFDKFLALTYVGYAFRGIQVAVVYLIASAGIKVIKGLKKNLFSILVASAVFVAFIVLSLFSVKFSTIFYILIAGVLGLMLYAVGQFREKKGKEIVLPDEETNEKEGDDPELSESKEAGLSESKEEEGQ